MKSIGLRQWMIGLPILVLVVLFAACTPQVPVTGSGQTPAAAPSQATAAPTMNMPTTSSQSPTTAPSSSGSSPSTGGTQAVSIQNFAFSPATLTVHAGAKVTWTNNDSTTHTVTADDKSFDSGQLAPGKTFDFTFNTPGTFSYHCQIHPNMVAKIIVTK